ncbi:MAG: hypothetical protein ABIP71_11660 [Verrucomicrobiota bacterium]
MKILSIILIFCAAFAPSFQAQNTAVNAVRVDLTLDQEQFLANEEVRIAVRITNRSGQELHLGKDADWITFTVDGKDHYVVSQLGDVPVQGEFSLASSKTGTKRVNLTPYFDFRQMGRYQVTASVKIPQWNKEITSSPISFDIIKGTKLLEFDFGVPIKKGDANAQPETRKYILQQAIYLNQMRLYLRLTDANDAVVFRVFPIAPMVSFSRPEAQVDGLSNLHVLHQTGAKSFNYSVIDPDGELVTRQTYDYTATRPILRPGGDGKISVIGGLLRANLADSESALTKKEIPKPAPQSSTNDAPTPKP